MKTNFFRHEGKLIIFVSLILIFCCHSKASTNTCPEVLKNWDSQNAGSLYLAGNKLCKIHERFQNAIKVLKSKNIENYDRISDILAPRFIGLPKWNDSKASFGYDPTNVYEPAPITWNQWDETQIMISELASSFLIHKPLNPITPELLEKIHFTSLRGLTDPVGKLRSTPEYGYNFNVKISLKERQTLINESYRSQSLFPDRPMLSWLTTKCFHELHYKDAIDVRHKWKDNTFVFNEKQWGVGLIKEKTIEEDPDQKECGVIVYPSEKNVRKEVELWSQATNSILTSWFTNSPKEHEANQVLFEDPVLSIAKTQKWLVTIHPLMDGNGRTSRFIMDFMFKVLQLPTPIIANMDDDLNFNDSAWAVEVGKGVLHTIEVLENCAADPSIKGCNQVPSSSDSRLMR